MERKGRVQSKTVVVCLHLPSTSSNGSCYSVKHISTISTDSMQSRLKWSTADIYILYTTSRTTGSNVVKNTQNNAEYKINAQGSYLVLKRHCRSTTTNTRVAYSNSHLACMQHACIYIYTRYINSTRGTSSLHSSGAV